MKLVVALVALLGSGCFSIPLRELHADVFYDAHGNLGYASSGAAHVERDGEMRELLDRNWLVTEIEPLPDGSGFVFAAGKDAPAYGALLTHESTTELWLFDAATQTTRRLTDDLALESLLVSLPDSSGVLFSSLRAEDKTSWGLMYQVGSRARLDFATCTVTSERSHWGRIVGPIAPASFASWEDVPIEHSAIVRGGPTSTERTVLLDVASGATETLDADRRWWATDIHGRTAAWLTATTSPAGRERRYVTWLDRASGVRVSIRTEGYPQVAISPDGERIALLEVDSYSVGLFVGVCWQLGRIREFDRAGRLLREIVL